MRYIYIICDVPTEAEEMVEHGAKIQHSLTDYSIPMDKINAWFAVRINKRPLKRGNGKVRVIIPGIYLSSSLRSKKRVSIDCVLCEVRPEAEEKVEHRAHNST